MLVQLVDCLCSRDGNVLKGFDFFNILLSPVLEVNRSSRLYLLLRELKVDYLTQYLEYKAGQLYYNMSINIPLCHSTYLKSRPYL